MAEPALDAPIPQGLDVQHEAGGLRLSYRWFSLKYIVFAGFCVLWDGFLIFWYRTALQNPNPGNIALWFPLLHVSVGVGLTYWTLAGFLNRTVIRVSQGSLSIQHGPLPWLGNRTVQTSEIRQLYREEIVSTGRRGTTSSYPVSAVLHSGGKLKLITTDAPDLSLALEQEIEKQLGLTDVRVVGEMRK